MTTRRKSKRQNESTSIDEKEHADRIAAAEAMSCLSSMLVLPSNADELLALGSDIVVESKIAHQNSTKNVAKAATSNANKKGKTRSRSSKKSPSSSSKSSPVSTGSESAANNKIKQKTPKYAPTLKRQKLPDQVLSLTINPRNPNHDSKKAAILTAEEANAECKEETIGINEKSPKPPVSSPMFIQVNSPITDQCTIQIDHNKPGQGLHNLSDTDLHKLLAGKLPFQVKATAENAVVSNNQVTVGTSSNIELSQATVNNLLTTMVLKQRLENQNRELSPSSSNLPLKKRRLQGYQEENLSNEAEEKVAETEENKQGVTVSERVNPVTVDPTTSLLLLNEIQVALQQDEDGDLPLHIAVVHENIVMVQKFVHLMSISGKSVDKYNKAQQTPLHLAVELNFVQAVQTLLLAGANPNLVNKNGENCIHMAVKINSLECLNLMLQYHKSLEVNARNFDGLAPIHVAVIKNSPPLIRFLLALKTDINIQDGKSGRTPLFYAVEDNNIPVVEMLQRSGANLDLPNYASVTAVMAAQARGFHEIAQNLLKCMDSKAYLEMNEKEKGIPLKKVPIPRIPSKSHLIQGTDSRPTVIDLQNHTNSDSDDSMKSSVSSTKKRNSNDEKMRNKTRPEKCESPKEPMETGVHEEKEIEVYTELSEDQDALLGQPEQGQEQGLQLENQESILIPRQLLEKLQSTMLSLLAMQKLSQAVTPTGSTAVLSSNTAPLVKTPVVPQSGVSTNALNLKLSQNKLADMDLHQNNILQTTKSVSMRVASGLEQKEQSVSTPAKSSSLSSAQLCQSNNVTSQVQPINLSGFNQQGNSLASQPSSVNFSLYPTPSPFSGSHGNVTSQVSPINLSSVSSTVIVSLPNRSVDVVTSNINKPTDLSTSAHNREMALANDSATNETTNQSLIKFGNKRRENHTVLQNLLNVKKGAGKGSQKRRISVDNSRVEEPMEITETESSYIPTKPGKTTGVGHAAMNQLGRETSVSSTLQATLLQMLRSKQMNKPLNLSTSKESSS